MPLPRTEKPQDVIRPAIAFWDRRWVVMFGGVLLAGVLLAAYHNTFRVPFLLDDFDSITKNMSIRSFATAFFPPAHSGITVSGRPFLNFTLAINYRLGGVDVLGYHAGNLLIHFAAALCLFGVVRRTLKLPVLANKFGEKATPVACLAAAIWALHPMQTESVTYVIQRAESLVGLCYLFTLYAFIRAVEKPSRGWTATTVMACLLGMASKEVMASAPLVLFLYDRTFMSGTFRESWRRHGRLHFALASSWLLLLACVISSGGRGSSVGFNDVSWFDYLLTQSAGIVTYLLHSIVPANLVFDYGAVIEKQPWALIRGLCIVITLFVTTIVLLRKRPALGFLGAWFFLILGPTSSVIPVATQTLAEHRMYLPLAALAVGVALLACRTIKNHYWIVLGSIAAIFVFVTVKRNAVYQTSLSIWEDTVRKVPDNVRALNNLGLFYLEDNRLEEAIQNLSEAHELAPEYPVACCNLGRALVSREGKIVGLEKPSGDLVEGVDFGQRRADGSAYLANPIIKEGLALLEKAISVEPGNAIFLAQYGNALLTLRQTEEAIVQLEKAVGLDPENYSLHYDLANTLSRLDRNEKAAEHFKAALRLKPDDAEALTNYGSLLRRMNQFSQSIENLQAACRLKPNMARAHSNLGVALLQSGRTQEGIHELETALQFDPNLAQARYNLFNAMAEADRPDEAIKHLEALLKSSPPSAELISNLGVLYARVGRLEDAVVQMRRALELDPKYEAAQENLAKITAYLRNHSER